MTAIAHVRQRVWYRRFHQLARDVEAAQTVEEVLGKVYDTLDKASAFGSRAAAEKAKESLEQAIKDGETA